MKFKVVSIFVVGFLLSGCLEKFDFERPESIKGAVAIQGKLTKGNPSRVEVILRDVFDFFNFPKLLTANRVYVVDENQNELVLTSKGQGLYFLDIPADHPFFKIEIGHKYKIRVEGLKGEDYESEYDELVAGPIPDDLYVAENTIIYIDRFGVQRAFDQLNFYISTPLKGKDAAQNSRLVWELNGVAKVTDSPRLGRCLVRKDPEPKACYVGYPPIKNYLTFDGTTASTDRIDDISVNESNYTNLFAEGYYMVVNQQAVSEPAFTYWSRVGAAVNRTGDVFQEPTGLVPTNIHNINDADDSVFGFFYVTEEHPIRVYVSPELGRNQKPQCPEVDMNGNLAAYCCNCLNLENSSTEQPDWWVE